MVEASWLLFVMASLALIATPGQDMMLVMSRAVARGTAAGIATAAGVSVGLVGHTILATFGLGAVLRSPSGCSSRSSSPAPRTCCISASACCARRAGI